MELKHFIGTKEVKAAPMTRLEYNEYRGWDVPENEDPTDPGFFLEYVNGGKPNDERHEGYISWSPADVFEAAYVPVAEYQPLPATNPVDAAPVVAGENVLSTWQSRLRAERAELADRLAKLRAFAQGTALRTLPLVEQQALGKQAKAMNDYLAILDLRISRL